MPNQHYRITGDTITVDCPMHTTPWPTGDYIRDPNHPTEHSFTIDEAGLLLRSLAVDDWEDGPRCLVEVLEEIRREGNV